MESIKYNCKIKTSMRIGLDRILKNCLNLLLLPFIVKSDKNYNVSFYEFTTIE